MKYNKKNKKDVEEVEKFYTYLIWAMVGWLTGSIIFNIIQWIKS